MSLDNAEFRRIMGHLVTGVTVVTTTDPESGQPCGLTANAVTSVSLNPALVLACVERGADTHDCIERAGVFVINVLRERDERVSRRFSAWDVDAKFEGIAFHGEVTGAPVLDDALAWVDCKVYAAYDGGDHTIFVGAVQAGDAGTGSPLLYYRGGYGRFVP
ncbi:MAG: flavin reductase family protein [Gemmatimonadota bacterium]|jgi:flavin reductase (DIM6/NTAB) family NADH-FMN oxidoreductase RutF